MGRLWERHVYYLHSKAKSSCAIVCVFYNNYAAYKKYHKLHIGTKGGCSPPPVQVRGGLMYHKIEFTALEYKMPVKLGDSESALRHLMTRYVYAALEDEDIASETVVGPEYHTFETLTHKDVKLKSRVSFSLEVAQVWNQIFKAFCAEVATSVSNIPDDATVDIILDTINAYCDEPISLNVIKFGTNNRPLFGTILTRTFDPAELTRAHMTTNAPILVSRPICTAKLHQMFDNFIKSIALYIARLLHYNDTTINVKMVFGILRLVNIEYYHIDQFNANFREKKKKQPLSAKLLALAIGGEAAPADAIVVA